LSSTKCSSQVGQCIFIIQDKDSQRRPAGNGQAVVAALRELDDLKSKFSVGTPVVVEGLQSHDHFNGKRGEIVEIPSNVGAAEPRWVVKLIEDGEGRQKRSTQIRVKHSNLRNLDDLKTKFSVGTHVVLYGLQSRRELNGKCGRIVRLPLDGAAEPRWGVELLEDSAAEAREHGGRKPFGLKRSNFFRVPSDQVAPVKRTAKRTNDADGSCAFGGLRRGFWNGAEKPDEGNKKPKVRTQESSLRASEGVVAGPSTCCLVQ
jgi:hypothetical protein